MPAHNRLLKRVFWLIFFTILGLMLWRGFPGIRDWLAPRYHAVPRAVTARGDLAADEKATMELFEKSRNSVVFITTKSLVRDFWTRNVFAVPRGSGSGFLWDDTGHVITNYHVIEGASEAIVKLSDGRDYRAALIGFSRPHDLAVLRIGVAAKHPPPLPLGSSGDLKVGQKVFAIGNPFGLDWSLTTGIVSALDRSLEGDGFTIEHLIQTDAAINPGNSGGPLLDSAGRLIGINTAIYSPSGASAGIGFAVPVDTVNRVAPQLIRSGKYIRPALGIEVDEGINERIKAVLGVSGIVILRVSPGSEAEKAGLAGGVILRSGEFIPGDIITAVNGKPVDTVGKLYALLDDFTVGDTVKLTLLTKGQTREVTATLQPGN